MSPTFVLGCERSGSTWLANVLDSHPGVELWMEPFADYAGLFPGLALRLPVAVDAGRVGLVRCGVARLTCHKHPLLYRRGRTTALESLDRRLAHGVRWTARRVGAAIPRWVQRYELLNLNAREVPTSLRVRKTRSPSLHVIKELRLNFAVALLREAFPEARFVVVLRHPVAQVASMHRWIGRGHLGELAAHLPAFLRSPAIPQPLRAHALLAAGREEELTAALSAYWIASHGALLGDLRERGCPHLVLRHEDLCSQPDARVAELLRFCGLDAVPEVAGYLAASTQGEARDPSPLDTRRASRTLSGRSLADASPALHRHVMRSLDAAAKEGLLDPGLEAYVADVTQRRFPQEAR